MKNGHKFIGIHGKARSGKDTLAGLIEKNLTGFHTVRRYSLAAPIKEACAAMFGWSAAHLYGDLKEVPDPMLGFSPRFAMQTLGTEWGRKTVVDDLWLRCALKRALCSEASVTIIPDVRFDNEADFILEQGGTLIHITREDRMSIGHAAQHESEKGLSKHYLDRCVAVENNGTIYDLTRQAVAITDMLK